MDKAALDQVSLRVLRISPVSIIPQMLHLYYMLLLPERQTREVWGTSNRIVFFGNRVYWTEKFFHFFFLTSLPQAASCWSLVIEIIARSKASQCEICGGQSGTRTGFSPSISAFRCPSFHQCPTLIFILMPPLLEAAQLGIYRISGSTGPKNKHYHIVFFPLHCGIPTQSTSQLFSPHPAFTRTAGQCRGTLRAVYF